MEKGDYHPTRDRLTDFLLEMGNHKTFTPERTENHDYATYLRTTHAAMVDITG